MEENAETTLRHVLEQPEAKDSADVKNFEKIKAAYGACLDESVIKQRGSKPLDELLARLQNIYPSKSGLIAGTQDHLTSALLFLMKSGVEALVSPGVSVSLIKSVSRAKSCNGSNTKSDRLMIGTLTMSLFL
jgi:endothelin-converting enzyme